MATKKASKKTAKRGAKGSTIQPTIINLGLKTAARARSRIFQCPTDCKTLTVGTRATPSSLIIVF